MAQHATIFLSYREHATEKLSHMIFFIGRPPPPPHTLPALAARYFVQLSTRPREPRSASAAQFGRRADDTVTQSEVRRDYYCSMYLIIPSKYSCIRETEVVGVGIFSMHAWSKRLCCRAISTYNLHIV